MESHAESEEAAGVRSYLQDVRRFAILRRDEDAELIPTASSDPEARLRLFRSYLELAALLALKLAPREVPALVAIEEANQILLRILADDVPEDLPLALARAIAEHFLTRG